MRVLRHIHEIIAVTLIAVHVTAIDVLEGNTGLTEEGDRNVGLRWKAVGAGKNDALRSIPLRGIQILRILATAVRASILPVRVRRRRCEIEYVVCVTVRV